MNSHDRDEMNSFPDPISSQARALFDRASEQLDSATGNRLRLLRREALLGGAAPKRPRWLPLGAAAATMLAVALGWWLPQRHAVAPADADVGISASDQDLLPDADADVYDWLGDAPVAVNDTQAPSP
jgi:hypothetical protein